LAGGVFRKIVRGDARSGEAFAAMARAYARLAEVLPTAPHGLALLPSARLLFGAHEVLVEMPALPGAREATDNELEGRGGGGVLAQVANAIVWLARARLIYVDLRPPNVLVADGDGGDSGDSGLARTWLVDFDDLLLTDAPVTTLEAYAAALASSTGDGGGDALAGDTFASSFGAGNQAAVERALASAFEAARLQGQ